MPDSTIASSAPWMDQHAPPHDPNMHMRPSSKDMYASQSYYNTQTSNNNGGPPTQHHNRSSMDQQHAAMMYNDRSSSGYGSYNSHSMSGHGMAEYSTHSQRYYGAGTQGYSSSGRAHSSSTLQQSPHYAHPANAAMYSASAGSRSASYNQYHPHGVQTYGPTRPDSQQSISLDMQGYRPNSAGGYNATSGAGYQQGSQYSPDFHRMQYAHHSNQYGYQRYPGHEMIPRSSSNTPSSQMAAMNFVEKKQGHAQLSTSFSSEQDDSSRTSSPAGIPPPPKMRVPMSAPAKIRVPIATRPAAEDALGPLRESSGRVNVLQESDMEDAVGRDDENSPNTSDSDDRQQASKIANKKALGKPKTEALVPPKKPCTSIHDASLLLGLRTTSSSNSPVTVPPSVTDISRSEDNEMDEVSGTVSFAESLVDDITNFVPYIPPNYPKRLALPQDRSLLNSLHCYIRANLLEIFVIETTKLKTPNLSPSTSVGRVGFRCVHCAEARKRTGISQNEAPMAVFYPKSVSEIYRMVTSWQRCHLRKCRNMPPSVRTEWEEIRETDKSRGKTAFWVISAKEIGLVDCPSRAGGVRFAPIK